MPGCIKPFIFCLFLFEADRRELWITVQVRGSDYTCAISDARTWAFIYPEVKTGLTPNHPLITKSPHQRISRWEKSEGSPLPGPWPWWEVMESAGQGAGWTIRNTITQGTRPAILPSTAKKTSCGVTWHCRKQSSQPRRLSTLSLLKWLNTQGKKSEYTVSFPRVSRSTLGNHLSVKILYISNGPFQELLLWYKKPLLIYQFLYTTDVSLCFLKHIWICSYSSFPSPPAV